MIRTSGQIFMPEKSTENNGKPQIRYYDTEKFANLALDEKTGASIALSIDTNTYIMTVALKNADGTVISSGQIDFPIESVVVNATYKDGILTLVLQNGNSVNVDISDIISGLVAEDGDGSNITVDFTQSSTRTNISTGEKLSTIFGKIKKWFADLKSLAFKSKTEAGDYTAGSITSTDVDSTIAKSADLKALAYKDKTSAGDYTAGSITSADTDSTIAKSADLKAENLLINPDFSINQRGQTSYTAKGYTVDRWAHYANSTVTVVENGVEFSTTSETYTQIYQLIEVPVSKLTGKTLTLSCSVNGVIYTARGTLSTNMGTKFSVTIPECGNATVRYSSTGGGRYYFAVFDVYVTNPTHKVNTINWAKLEIGSTATAFVPSLIAEELPKCQRYGFLLASGPVRYPSTQIDNSIIDFTIPTPVSLRTPPTLSNTANIVVYNPDNAMAVQSGFTFSVAHTTSNAICIRATKSGHGLSRAILGFTANVFLDAEIY